MLQTTVAGLLGLRSDEIGRRAQDVRTGDRLPVVMVNNGFWDGSEQALSISEITSDSRFPSGVHRVFLTLDGAVIDPMVECDGDDSRLLTLWGGGGVELYGQRDKLIAAGEDPAAIGYLNEPRLPGIGALIGDKLVLLSDHWDLLGNGKGDSLMIRADFEKALAAAIITRKVQWEKARADAIARGLDPDMLGG